MGLLRITLALAVVVAHTHNSLFGLPFFGGGVMAVESFFMISGFYMALVLKSKYKNNLKHFYFNRFIRLFPIYWVFLLFSLLTSAGYFLLTGKALGALSVLPQFEGEQLYLLWAVIANLTSLGIDAALLFTRETGINLNGLMVISAAWSLSVEIAFYIVAPWIMNLKISRQIALLVIFLGLRLVVFILAGYGWSHWNYFFVLTALPFFIGGIMAHHLYEAIQTHCWFKKYGQRIGMILLLALLLVIVNYQNSKILAVQDWRYYLCFAATLPFIFELTRLSKLDRSIGEYSYPLYLSHVVMLSLWAPMRHFVPEGLKIYFLLLLCLVVCSLALKIDNRIQGTFKRKYLKIV